MTPDTIPISLRNLPRWLSWELAPTATGGRTKRPNASTARGPWRDLESILGDVPPESLGASRGIGFVTSGDIRIGEGRSVFAVDLDGCRDPASGAIAPWARDVVKAFRSYTEASPSGTGLRIFGYLNDRIPRTPKIVVDQPVLAGEHRRCEIQVFGAGPASYVTVTGERLVGAPADLTDGAAGFSWLAEHYPRAVVQTHNPDFTPTPIGRKPSVDEIDALIRSWATSDVIELAETGKWEGTYPSASEGWFTLVTQALRACAGHLEPAVEWLIDRTAYGLGLVEGSKDPVRYCSAAWVLADVRRVASKSEETAAAVFTPVAFDGPALSEGQKSLFDTGGFVADGVDAALPFDVVNAPAMEDEDASGFFEPVGALMRRDPQPRWLVRGVLEQDALVVVSGAPASFKSFLLFDMSLALATDRDWHGYRTRSAPVLLIVGEGRGGLSRRFRAWAAEYEDSLADARLAISRHAAQFLDDKGFQHVVAEAKKMAVVWKQNPGLIVVDTLNRNFGPGDENDTGDMSSFWTRCDALRRIFPGCTVAVVHHVGHGAQNRARGSSVIGATVNAEMLITRPREAKTDRPKMAARVDFRKMKDAEEPAPIWMAMRYVPLGTDDEGEGFGSLIVDRLTSEEPAAGGEALADEQTQSDLDVVLRVYDARPQATKTEAVALGEIPRRRFDRAVSIALEYGLLTRVGHTSNTTHEITAAGSERLLGADGLGGLLE